MRTPYAVDGVQNEFELFFFFCLYTHLQCESASLLLILFFGENRDFEEVYPLLDLYGYCGDLSPDDIARRIQ